MQSNELTMEGSKFLSAMSKVFLDEKKAIWDAIHVLEKKMQKSSDAIETGTSNVLRSIGKVGDVVESKCKALEGEIQTLKDMSKQMAVASVKETPVPTPVKAPDTIDVTSSSEDEDEEDDFVVRDMTPKNSIKVKVPRGSETMGVVFEKAIINEKEYTTFKVKKTGSLDVSKLSIDHYIVMLDGKDVSDMKFDAVLELLKSKLADGCDVYFKRFTVAERRQRAVHKDKMLLAVREKLWKIYGMVFSEEWQKDNAGKYNRYRPNNSTCGNKRANEVLNGLVVKRCKAIAKHCDFENVDMQMVYDKLEKMSDNTYAKVMTDIEDHVLGKRSRSESPQEPVKKAKTLREIFAEKGQPASAYDALSLSLTDEQIRAMFKY